VSEQGRQDKFQRLVEAAEVLIIGLDARGRITLFNQKCEEVTGYSREEVLGKSLFTILIPKEERKDARQRFKKILAGEKPKFAPLTSWMTKDGVQRFMRWNTAIFTDTGGQVSEIFSLGIDITKQREVEEKLRENEERFRVLAENAQDVIYLYSILPERKFDYVSPAVFRVTGYTPKEFYDDPDLVVKIVHPDDLSVLQGALQDPTSFGGPSEIRWVRKDGESIWTEQQSTVLQDEKGNLVAVHGVVRDITARKQVIDEMDRARNLAEFLVDLMAHDLNNINQGIMSAMEILQHDPSFPESLQRRLSDALSQVERSADLIDSVKRFQRVDIEPVTLRRMDVFPPLQSAIEAVERNFPTKSILITNNIRERQFYVTADQFLSELFFNILHNAAKFDRSERVSIDVRADLTADERFLRVNIMDHGPGISDDEKARIFSRMTSRRSGVKGSGMGLTLVGQILHRYGGNILVADRVDGDYTQGASFVILLPKGEV
jgi:PAS domain S-box-containing protein